MRRSLRPFLPIFLVALLVQIFAPVAACWSAGDVASDQIAMASICHGGDTSGPEDHDPDGHTTADRCCPLCGALQTGSLIGPPEASPFIAASQLHDIVWIELASAPSPSAPRSTVQARAPPPAS